MSSEIMEKLLEHDKKFIEHDKKFFEHGEILKEHTNILNEHSKKFIEHDRRFDQIDERLDLLSLTVLDHSERLDRIETNMATKSDIAGLTKTLDQIVYYARKTDQEMIFLSERVRRVEDDVKLIKPLVGLAS
ncbi:MAG: hypothetical protein WC750_01915 [Patescibacteria group bacterium]